MKLIFGRSSFWFFKIISISNFYWLVGFGYFINELDILHITMNVIKNLHPCPTTLSTFIVPLIYSTIDLQIEGPRPKPEWLILLCSSKLLKLMNKLSNYFCGNTQPKFCTLNSNLILQVLSFGKKSENYLYSLLELNG